MNLSFFLYIKLFATLNNIELMRSWRYVTVTPLPPLASTLSFYYVFAIAKDAFLLFRQFAEVTELLSVTYVSLALKLILLLLSYLQSQRFSDMEVQEKLEHPGQVFFHLHTSLRRNVSIHFNQHLIFPSCLRPLL